MDIYTRTSPAVLCGGVAGSGPVENMFALSEGDRLELIPSGVAAPLETPEYRRSAWPAWCLGNRDYV